MIPEVDVLFVYTNINGCHLDTYNFGIGYLSSVLKEAGFKVRLEVVKSEEDYHRVIDAVLTYKPKIIGFSAVSSQFVFIRDLAKMIKKVFDCIIVCGGVHPTILPECLVSSPQFDGIFRGECESSFLEFVSAVSQNSNYRNVDNFCYIDNGKLVMNKLRQRLKSLEGLPFPDRDIYDYQAVIDGNEGVATIMTKRGCPFHCTYCSNHAIARVYGVESNNIRYNSVDRVMAEIEMLNSKYRFQRLWFIDDLFILDKKWLDEFCIKYKQRFSYSFMVQIRPNITTREILFKLKDAGCYKIFVAVESANDYIRKVVMKRDIEKEHLENTFKWAKEAGLETLSVNIIGVPGDTVETIMETINFNKRMQPTMAGTNVYSPYEGTELGDYCRKHGLISKRNARSFFDRRQSRLILPTISPAKLKKLYENFQYLVYKDSDSARAKHFLYAARAVHYNAWERYTIFGPLIKRFKSINCIKRIAKKILLGR